MTFKFDSDETVFLQPQRGSERTARLFAQVRSTAGFGTGFSVDKTKVVNVFGD